MLTNRELKFLRLRKGISQTDMALVMGISREFLSMVESGKRDLSEERYKQYINAIYKICKMKPSDRKKLKSKQVEQEQVEEGVQDA